jgi:chromosome segregation ATPase
MGDESEELGKLKNVLQKLQAENISLKAQLGTMTQEEKDVQKELSATVAEIGNLSNQLQGLRSEVLGAKTNLLEASAQLKAAQQQKR